MNVQQVNVVHVGICSVNERHAEAKEKTQWIHCDDTRLTQGV